MHLDLAGLSRDHARTDVIQRDTTVRDLPPGLQSFLTRDGRWVAQMHLTESV